MDLGFVNNGFNQKPQSGPIGFLSSGAGGFGSSMTQILGHQQPTQVVYQAPQQVQGYGQPQVVQGYASPQTVQGYGQPQVIQVY